MIRLPIGFFLSLFRGRTVKLRGGYHDSLNLRLVASYSGCSNLHDGFSIIMIYLPGNQHIPPNGKGKVMDSKVLAIVRGYATVALEGVSVQKQLEFMEISSPQKEK